MSNRYFIKMYPLARTRFSITCLLGILGLLLVQAVVADEETYSRLIFDPVPIQIEIQEIDENSDDEESEPLTLITELEPLPKAQAEDSSEPGNPVDSSALINNLLSNQAEIENRMLELQQKITRFELQGGPYDRRLGQEYSDLGSLYLEQQMYAEAIDVYEKALHATRVNEGLYTIAQIPIVEKKIVAHMSNRDITAAHAEQRYLYFLKRRLYRSDANEYMKSMVSFADWNLYAFTNKYEVFTVDLFRPDEFFVDSINEPVYGESQSNFLDAAFNAYQEALFQADLNPAVVDSDEYERMERNFVITCYLISKYTHPAVEYNSAFTTDMQSPSYTLDNMETYSAIYYRKGRDVLNNKIRRIRNQAPGDMHSLVKAYIELGDWQLIFEKRNTSQDTYEQAYQLLDSYSGPDITGIKKLFNPLLPQPLPAFNVYNYTRAYHMLDENMPIEYQGHIDLEFEISRFGRPYSFETLDTSSDIPEDLENILVRNLRRSLFRPYATEDGKIEDKVIRLRYYYSYL